MRPKVIFSALFALMVSACSDIKIDAANLPLKFSNIEIKKDISFGDDDIQKLDIYIPPHIEGKKLPVLVFFYGGRWEDGNKEMYGFVAHRFAKAGYITVIPDYQKYPTVKFPIFVEDAAKATAWVHNNIDKYNGDARNIFLSGHSSGAHLGALVTVDERYLKAYDKSTDIIKGFAGLAGPYDFVPQEEDLKDMFGYDEYPKAMATPYVDGDEPPMLLLWGEKDNLVWARNHKLLSEKILEEKGEVEVKTYKDLNHFTLIGALTWLVDRKNIVYNDITEFFEKYKTKKD